MTQEAVVVSVLPGGDAEVAVKRGTACGGSCGSCESCIYQSELRCRASNPLGASRGQQVIIESRSSQVYRAALITYILPVVLLAAGYIVAFAAGAGEGVCILSAFLALAAGVACTVLSQRRKKPIEYEITGII